MQIFVPIMQSSHIQTYKIVQVVSISLFGFPTENVGQA